jgi:hypothetical protein
MNNNFAFMWGVEIKDHGSKKLMKLNCLTRFEAKAAALRFKSQGLKAKPVPYITEGQQCKP